MKRNEITLALSQDLRMFPASFTARTELLAWGQRDGISAGNFGVRPARTPEVETWLSLRIKLRNRAAAIAAAMMHLLLTIQQNAQIAGNCVAHITFARHAAIITTAKLSPRQTKSIWTTTRHKRVRRRQI